VRSLLCLLVSCTLPHVGLHSVPTRRSSDLGPPPPPTRTPGRNPTPAPATPTAEQQTGRTRGQPADRHAARAPRRTTEQAWMGSFQESGLHGGAHARSCPCSSTMIVMLVSS